MFAFLVAEKIRGHTLRSSSRTQKVPFDGLVRRIVQHGKQNKVYRVVGSRFPKSQCPGGPGGSGPGNRPRVMKMCFAVYHSPHRSATTQTKYQFSITGMKESVTLATLRNLKAAVLVEVGRGELTVWDVRLRISSAAQHLKQAGS